VLAARIVVPEMITDQALQTVLRIRQMRKTQTNWRRCWSQKWLRKFIAISLATTITVCSLSTPSGWAAGGNKRPPRNKPNEKVARKLDDDDNAASLKNLPKAVADNHPLKPFLVKAATSMKAVEEVKD
jgi:hypothetical protein